jgi:2-polyprenyl-6-methoxyphenol hydroxylase-like FAD-dependent oxidoreductase
VVVGADGKYSRVAEWTGAARYEETPALRPLYFGYYRDVTPQTTPALEIFYHEGRIGFVMPMEPGIDCIALEIRADEFPAFRADPEGRLDATLRTLPGMESRLARAERDGPARGTRGVDNYLRVPYGPGWALTGDAACCKDPSTGTGIEDAFRQSFLLADHLSAVLDGAEWDSTMAAYHHRRDEAVLPNFRGTLRFTQAAEPSPEAVTWLQAIAANAAYVRLLGQAFPAAVQAPGVLPASLLASIERSAVGFAAARDAELGRPAA